MVSASSSAAGANLGSHNQVKIRLAFIVYRRVTCATETPGARDFAQIDRFSSSDQNRFLGPFLFAIECLRMPIIENGQSRLSTWWK